MGKKKDRGGHGKSEPQAKEAAPESSKTEPMGGTSEAVAVVEAVPPTEQTKPATATATGTRSEKDAGVLAPIVERLRAGRCVLCAGSKLTGAKSYRALVEAVLGAVEGVDPNDAQRALAKRPLAAAGFARRRLGDRFLDELRRAAAAPGELPEAARLLGELPFRAIVTTSYDDTFERAFTREGAAPRVYTPADHLELKKDGKSRFVFKALGDPSRAETVVWSAEDLQGALADGGYRSVAHDLYRSRSFLFVGFDGEDPDLGILLERVLSGARAPKSDDAVEHYALLKGLSQIEREELYAAYRIRVLELDEESELARALKDALGDQVGPALPDDDDLDGWLQLLGEDPKRADALDRLVAMEKRARQANDHERLVEIFLGRVGVEPDAQHRAQMLLEVAQLFENQVGDLAKAFTALVAAYKESPRPDAWNDLERLASATGMWTELLSELAEVVPQLPDHDRANAWVRIAKLYGDKLSHSEYALTSVEEALKLAPENVDAQEMRIGLLRRAERWKDLVEALWKRAAVEDSPAKKSELYIEQADLYETRLGDGAGAARCYRQALEADPSSTDAREALELLLRRRGEWRELLPLLDEKAQHLIGDEATAIKREAAELCADKLGDRRAAAERYEALARETPRDLATLRALERIYTADGRHDEYLSVLGQQADAVESERERAALYRRLAAEWEEQPGGGAKAAEWLERLLALDARSEDAFRSLERIYKAERKWDALVDVFRRHGAIVPAPLRAEIFAQVGAIYDGELRDPSRAIEAYLDVESALPGHAEALAALTRLYEKTEAWEKTVEILEKRASLQEVRSQRVELLHRAGQITAEKIGDAKTAEQRFVRALELDDSHAPSMTALVEIYRKNGEFLKAAKLLVEAVPHVPNRLERTRLLVEAGEIYDGLEDHKKAIELYLEALSVDPEHVEAAERVSELLWKSERYAELVPILEMLTRKEAEPSVQVERLTRLGRAAQSVGDADKTLKAWTRAAELDPTRLEAQRGRAQLLYGREEWKDALPSLEQVFAHHFESLPPSERVELLHQLGVTQLKLGDKDAAKKWLGRALDIDPTHRPSLLLQMEFGEAKPESLIDAKKALLATATPDEKIRLLGEIGDLYLDKLEDPPLAVGAYREALELRPEDHKLLHKCLDVYVEQKQWAQALDMLERLIAIEKVATVRAKYKHAAGLIARDELGRSEQAAKLLYEALDDDPTMDRSAEALEELFKERQDWKELTRYYRKALKRLGPETGDGKNSERLRLWSALGEICLDKLGEPASALAALEVAVTFDRGNLDRHKQLADLYVQAGPDYFDKAIVEHQILLSREKNRVISYRALKHLYIQVNQREKSAACSYALTFLKKGEADDQKIVAELKQRAMQPVKRALNDELWQRLAHPDEDRVLQALFVAVTPVLAQAQAQAHKALGLNRKDAIESADPRMIAKALRYVASSLSVAPPESYVKYEQKDPVVFQNAIDKTTLVPVFVLGAPLLGDKRPERDLVFELARRIAHLRPERFIRYALPQPAQLAHVIEAAMAIGDEGAPGGRPPTGELQKTAQAMKKSLAPVALETVAACGRKLRAAGTKPEAAALLWLHASDLTASRAGLVLGQDLETCARLLAAEPQSAAALPAMQRLLDLVWSSVTEDLFAVRKHVGTL